MKTYTAYELWSYLLDLSRNYYNGSMGDCVHIMLHESWKYAEGKTIQC